ncbi:MAG TPA: magnesium and cobalt transport protein CorA [Rhodospirillaceae bacterium]|nr:magnesium and cobalt transport protein CorA [Rhodospirillaceae bacterium]
MKAKLLRKHKHRPGRAPGQIEAPEGAVPSVVTMFAYDLDRLEEVQGPSPDKIRELLKNWPLVWVNVSGLADVGLIEEIGKIFEIHSLAMEDILHIPQRAKVDEFENCLFAVFRMATPDGGSYTLEQMSMLFGRNFVLTFQERPGDIFDPVRERIRKGRAKMSKADYLAYALLDAVIDGYFPVMEHYNDKLDALEEGILTKPVQEHVRRAHKIKRELQILRHCIWPLRESVANMKNGENEFVSSDTQVFLRDCQDHVIQVLDILDSYRERVSGLTDLYQSTINMRMNEVIKVLTIITTIFMPLSFLAGIYGMNFDTSSPYNMPELGAPFGYPVLLAVMAATALGMLIYFRRLGWLGNGDNKKR